MGIRTVPRLSTLIVLGCVWMGQTQGAIAGNHGQAQTTLSQSCDRLPQAPETPLSPGCAIQLKSQQRSLTVVGQGQVTVPADTALLEFQFGVRDRQPGVGTQTMGLSIQVAKQATEETLQPIVKALTAIGVPDRDLSIQMTSSLQNPKLLVKLEKPTQERVQQIVLQVDQLLQSNQQLFLQSVGAGYSVNSCQALERATRRIALQDAKQQLMTLAQDVGVTLGELLFVTAYPLEGAPSSIGCGSKVGVPASLLSLSSNEPTPPYNPSEKPEVKLRSQVSVTYGIKESHD